MLSGSFKNICIAAASRVRQGYTILHYLTMSRGSAMETGKRGRVASSLDNAFAIVCEDVSCIRRAVLLITIQFAEGGIRYRQAGSTLDSCVVASGYYANLCKTWRACQQ